MKKENSIKMGASLLKILELMKQDSEKENCCKIGVEGFVYFVCKKYIGIDEAPELGVLNDFFHNNRLSSKDLDDILYIAKENYKSVKNTYNKKISGDTTGEFITVQFTLYINKAWSKTNKINLDLEVEDLFLEIVKSGATNIFDNLENISKEDCIDDLLIRVVNSEADRYSTDFASNMNMTSNTFSDNEYSSESSTPSIPDLLKFLGLAAGGKIGEDKSNENSTPPSESEMKKEDDDFDRAGESTAVNTKKVDPNSKTPFLDQYSYDMTFAAKNGKYDPVVGRDVEIGQIIKIISCRKKNNAILLGDPGCGKTAIVESLSQKIIDGKVPFDLRNKRICSLDLNALVSGTKYRGEYEERLQGIIKEVCNNKDIIVYIDEFHNLIGNGSTSGSGDGANILKPYLARGEFQCIGSTTQEEYRKFVKDGALKRRFQCVQIDEPTVKETIEILKEIAPKYEEYHRVKYSAESIKLCVELSGRYITDKFFPDKAIDILDTAGAQMKLFKKRNTTDIDNKKAEIEVIKKKKLSAVESQDFELAAKYRDEQLTCQKEYDNLIKQMTKKDKSKKLWPEVTDQVVCEVVSGITGIPIDQVGKSDLGKLKSMKKELGEKIIGQKEAVDTFVTVLQRNYLGLRDETKCIASILLTGPSGTGKTLICEEVAKRLFGNEEAFIKFNMGEMTSEHEASKLIGSPAGYVGYEDEPLLLQVKRHPSSLVLFDEIEKAHPKIFDIFLGIMDKGEITLNNGERVDFKNCIVVFTGNIGTKEIEKFGKGLGFNRDIDDKNKTNTEIVTKSIKKTFRPEFINRLTNMVTFNELGKPELLKIFNLEFNKLKDRLKVKGYSIKASNSLKNHIVDLCDPIYGARDLQRNIQNLIETNVCTSLLEKDDKDLANINSISVDYKDDKVVVKFNTDKKPVTKKVEVKAEEDKTPETKQD